MKAFELGHVRKKGKEGKGKYYGRTGDHLVAYEDEFRRRNGKHPNPIESETNETALVVSRHGKPHGRYPLLNAVIQPTIIYSQVRFSSTSASTANPTWARPSRSREEDAYFKVIKLFRQECEEHDSKMRVLEDYHSQQMTNVYSALENGTTPLPMVPAPPHHGPYPKLISFEEFLARGTGTPGSHESNIGGGSSTPGGATPASSTPGGATPGSRSPVTLVWLGGGGASTSTRGSPLP